MYNKEKIKELILEYQEEDLKDILEEIESIGKAEHLNSLEKLAEISTWCEDFDSIKDDIILDCDIDKYINEELVESAVIKAKEYVEREEIPNYLIDYHIKGFIAGYLGEHIKIYKRLENIDDEKVKILLNEKKM